MMNDDDNRDNIWYILGIQARKNVVLDGKY